MKIFKLIVSILFLSGFILTSCNKLAYKYNKDFEGNWFTDKKYDSFVNDTVRSQILIDGSDGKFNNTCLDDCLPNLCGCISTQAGKAEMNSSKTQMKIGSAQGAQPLTINQEPYQEADGTWKMEVNNLVYTRQ